MRNGGSSNEEGQIATFAVCPLPWGVEQVYMQEIS